MTDDTLPTSSDDPWLAAYLKLRAAVIRGEIKTSEEITTYAAELRGDLPGAPSVPVAALIAADIKITFPVRSDQLWVPRR